MSGLKSLVRRHLFTLLLLLLAGGFAVILGELVLYKHWEGTQLIGFTATIVGLVAVVAGLFAKATLRPILAILLLVLSFGGLLGVREHLESAAEEQGEAQHVPVGNQQISLTQEDEEGEGAKGEAETVPPPLAPLGVSGLALMGFVLLFARRDDE